MAYPPRKQSVTLNPTQTAKLRNLDADLSIAVLREDYGAHTLLIANTDSSPEPLSFSSASILNTTMAGDINATAIPFSTLIGRTSDSEIKGLSLIEVRNMFVETRHIVVVAMAVSDETTALTVDAPIWTFRMPHALTLTEVRISLTTAPTGSTVIVDINKDGSTILSTKLTIDSTEKASITAATPAVISDTALADNAEITIDVDQIGSSVAGTGLKIYLIGTQA